jgi:hypothetical protein
MAGLDMDVCFTPLQIADTSMYKLQSIFNANELEYTANQIYVRK